MKILPPQGIMTDLGQTVSECRWTMQTAGENSMDWLPVEIWERITLYLDGCSLVRAKQTCTKWKEIIEHLELHQNAWQVRCESEIDGDTSMELLGRIHPKLAVNVKSKVAGFWRHVYITWFKQRHVHNDHDSTTSRINMRELWFRTENVCPSRSLPTLCSCMVISGKRILTGHLNGPVCMWNVTGHFIKPVLSHNRPVTDIAVMDYYNSEFSEMPNQYAENYVSHHHVLTTGQNRLIHCVSLLDVYDPDAMSSIELESYVKTIRIFNDMVAALCDNGNVHIFKMLLLGKAPTYYLEFVRHCKYMSSHNAPFTWMTFWNNRVTCITESFERQTVEAGLTQWTSQWPSLVENYDGPLQNIVAINCCLYRNNITVMLTAEKYLCISVDGIHYRPYSTMKDLRGVVTSFTIAGNLLALGMDIGRIHVYYFETDEDLMELDLSKPVFSKDLFDHSVSCISIRLDHMEPLISASGNWEICVVRFVAEELVYSYQ